MDALNTWEHCGPGSVPMSPGCIMVALSTRSFPEQRRPYRLDSRAHTIPRMGRRMSQGASQWKGSVSESPRGAHSTQSQLA